MIRSIQKLLTGRKLFTSMAARSIPTRVEVPIVSQKQQEDLEPVGIGLAPIPMGPAPIDAEEGQVEEVQTGSVTPVSTSASPTSPSISMAEDAAPTDAQETPTSGESQSTAEAPQKRRRKGKGKWVSIEEISPKPSYWPLALTVSISVLLMGIMIHPIVIGVGALLVIASIMGWMLERR
jgi:hypothetical protein